MQRSTPALLTSVLLALSTPAHTDAPTPEELRVALTAADTVQVSSFVLDWRDSTVAGQRKLVSLRRRLAFAPAKPGWARRLAPVLLPPGSETSKDTCPVLNPARSGPGPWLASIVWTSRASRGQAIVDIADSCVYVVSAGRDPISVALGERVDDLFGMLREALPADSTLRGATVASLATPDDARATLPGIRDVVSVDALPVCAAPFKPLYPDLAREAKVQGTVLLKALVDRDGDVRDVVVLKSIPMLDAAAIASVRQWHFEPARFRNRPVAVWVAVPVQFTLR